MRQLVRLAFAAAISCVAAAGLSGCIFNSTPPNEPSDPRSKALQDSLVGKWASGVQCGSLDMTVSEDQIYIYGYAGFTGERVDEYLPYRISDGKVIVTTPTGDGTETTETAYSVEFGTMQRGDEDVLTARFVPNVAAEDVSPWLEFGWYRQE